MGSLLKLLGVILATSFALALLTIFREGTLDSELTLLGIPVVSIAQVGAFGWLAIGQAATGVLVIAQGGAGVVAIVQGGASIFFGIGQGMISLVSIAQIGAGFVFFLGQLGLGAQAMGQGVFKRRSKEYFRELGEEMNAVLSFGGR